MDKFIHRENLALFKKRLGEPRTDPEREVLMKLPADEEATEPPTGPHEGQCRNPPIRMQESTDRYRGTDFPVSPLKSRIRIRYIMEY
jgi:hypothetical protein